ncbi:unnamed protein product [Rotaria socialis]|uniref:Ig-like domain-containing protein n=2 Tax=Rotaria socialis TaxID=392032 RepID=A0A818C0D0_9BILA|nr:unnamed protein product [Rotaria socialis]CAF3411510.1 unnamed protein product [Rotaria socialis]CAF3417327.1 unnamed protein product [Rotaria socialis]CAF3441471.1 unnamed protein product [Rotaria socialis]CAF3670481.1 unnamed protein product [Rotaria socialis]
MIKKLTMFFVSIIFLTIVTPSIQTVTPSLKLTFTPDVKFYAQNDAVEIHCEILNPLPNMEPAQLWHVDLKTGKHTQISRSLIKSPAGSDIPDTFKKNTNRRIEYIQKNHIRISHLQMEDSASFECNCPDCDQPLGEQKRLLQVMKIALPKWHVEPGWPIQEKAKAKIRCTVDDFYPFVSFKIIRKHHEITSLGTAIPIVGNVFPQKFSWEADVEPEDNWHNTSLQCIVTQGSTDQHIIKNFEVLFTPRFVQCDEKQYVNSTKENATIECEYSGNPAPILTWFRQSDDKPLKSETGITIETKDEHHGKYKSIVTFDREKLITIPLSTTLSTTTKLINGKPETTTKPKGIGDNYYQQLLSDGFSVKLTYNNEEKGTRKISIVSDVNDARSNSLDNSSTKTIQCLSTAIILLSLLTTLFMIQRH